MPVEFSLTLGPGTLHDYKRLAAYHYRAGPPAVVTRVWCWRDGRRTAVDRLLGRECAPRPVAVLVESMPVLNCRARDGAVGALYAGLGRSARARWLNRHVRCISRVVVDPRYRGLGLGVSLVRACLDNAQTPFVETLAAMGRVHALFRKAGMRTHPHAPSPDDERLRRALRAAGLTPNQLADPAQASRQISGLSASAQEMLRRELQRWHGRTCGRTRRQCATTEAQLRAARGRLLSRPAYYLWAKGDVQSMVNA